MSKSLRGLVWPPAAAGYGAVSGSFVSGAYSPSTLTPAQLAKAAAEATVRGKTVPKSLQPYIGELKRVIQRFAETGEPEAFVEAVQLHDRIRQDLAEGKPSASLREEAVMSKLKIRDGSPT